jgi:signal peptidase I
LAILGGLFMIALVVLRLLGLIRPFTVPTSAMAPSLQARDHVLMEGISFLTSEPQRGDIAVFSTDGIAKLPRANYYVKRIVGEPGEHLRITNGHLFINDKQIVPSNDFGPIQYRLSPKSEKMAINLDLTIPEDHYYVVGDNAPVVRIP